MIFKMKRYEKENKNEEKKKIYKLNLNICKPKRKI